MTRGPRLVMDVANGTDLHFPTILTSASPKTKLPSWASSLSSVHYPPCHSVFIPTSHFSFCYILFMGVSFYHSFYFLFHLLHTFSMSDAIIHDSSAGVETILIKDYDDRMLESPPELSKTCKQVVQVKHPDSNRYND